MKYYNINKEPIEIGDRGVNITGNKFTVIAFVGKTEDYRDTWTIRFDSGYGVNAVYRKILLGCIKDRFAVSVCGVGILGYKHKLNNTRYKQLWTGIIYRCHDPLTKSFKFYGAKGVRLCNRWYRYDYFLDDLPYIDGYNHDLIMQGLLHLDKDMKQINTPYNQRIYSKDTCTFMAPDENQLYKPLPNNTTPVTTMYNENIYDYQSRTTCAADINICPETIKKNLNTNIPYKGYKFYDDSARVIGRMLPAMTRG